MRAAKPSRLLSYETLSAITALAQDKMQTLQAFRQPAPPQKTQECEGE